MSGLTHTPGPWKLDSGPSFHRNRVWTQDMRPIVSMLPMSATIAEFCPEALANARLIAAAPDLLAALKHLGPILSRAESNASGNPEWECVSERINMARAAITKATGA